MDYRTAFKHLKASIEAEQVFCSIVTEMKFMPQFADDPNLRTVHRENYETSYHRNTAAGNLRRLLRGETAEMLILMTVECFIESREHDRKSGEALDGIQSTGPHDEKWLESAKYWHAKRKQQLKHARNVLYNMIGPDVWQKGAALAE